MRSNNWKLFFITSFIAILFFNFSYALKGGEEYLYHFEYCENLKVNISGDLQIDDGEYIINSACEKNGTDYWKCNCTNNWYFNLTPLPNAINNYSILFIYDYEIEEKKKSGGRSRRRNTDIFPEVENATNESRNDTIPESPITEEPLIDEIGKDKVVAPSSSNTGKQKETPPIEEPQLDVDGNNTQTVEDEKKKKPDGIIKWWMVPLFIIIFLIVIVSFIIFYLFRDEPSEGVGRTETQLKREMKEIEDSINQN